MRLLRVEFQTPDGPVLHVARADLVDGTQILDIRPYLLYADCRPEATGGFAPGADDILEDSFPPELLEKTPEEKRDALLGILAQKPQPRYQQDPDRGCGLSFGE